MQLARMDHNTVIWEYDREMAEAHQAARENTRYLPNIPWPSNLSMTNNMAEALKSADIVIAVVPSQTMRATMTMAAPFLNEKSIICVASKGVEQGSLMTMDEVLCETIPAMWHEKIAVLSGPSFALEVAHGMPTAVVVAGKNEDIADTVATAFHGGSFRVYHSTDVVGVEMGGALKNVVAIACGISDGAGFGHNTRAALITRGLAEITRLAVARKANPLTLSGLAGMGDLVLTCTGDLSRNRQVGLALGKGKNLTQILEELGQVAEGVATARSAHNLGKKMGVDLPLTDQIYQIIYENKPVQEALGELLGRERKAELD
tara:strand:- start:380 stop:1333 length:954 start_codon:yes stop_codon:yes gene_type:complete